MKKELKSYEREGHTRVTMFLPDELVKRIDVIADKMQDNRTQTFKHLLIKAIQNEELLESLGTLKSLVDEENKKKNGKGK